MMVLRLPFKTAAAAQPADAGAPAAREAVPTKKKQMLTQDKAETKLWGGSSGGTRRLTSMK